MCRRYPLALTNATAYAPRMSHQPKSVAPESHPVCCSCADLPLSDMPSPKVGEVSVSVAVGSAALSSIRSEVWRFAGADVEHCCWCGVETDQAYYALSGPATCSPLRLRYRPAPGLLRRAWRRFWRWLFLPKPSLMPRRTAR